MVDELCLDRTLGGTWMSSTYFQQSTFYGWMKSYITMVKGSTKIQVNRLAISIFKSIQSNAFLKSSKAIRNEHVHVRVGMKII